MVKAWFMDNETTDQRLEHHRNPPEFIEIDELFKKTGVDGSGYFDVRDDKDNWIRIAATKGELIIIPAGLYHRFTLDANNYIKAKRYFVGGPVWLAYNRPADEMDCRREYLKHQSQGFANLNKV